MVPNLVAHVRKEIRLRLTSHLCLLLRNLKLLICFQQLLRSTFHCSFEIPVHLMQPSREGLRFSHGRRERDTHHAHYDTKQLNLHRQESAFRVLNGVKAAKP